MSESSPDADERIVRRAKLHADIAAFLDEGFVGPFEGDGAAPASREQMQSLFDLCYELAQLKFSRCCDDRTAIDVVVSARHNGHLVHTLIPHEPRFMEKDERTGKEQRRDPTTDEMLEHVSELMRSHSYLAGTASDLARRIEFLTQENVRARKARVAFLEKVAAIKARIEAKDDFKEVARDLDSISRTEEGSELQKLYRVAYGDIFGTVEDALVDLIGLAETSVQIAHVRSKIIEALPKYGPFGLAKAVNIFNNGVQRRWKAAYTAYKAEHGDNMRGFSYDDDADPRIDARSYTAEFRQPQKEKA